MVLEMFFFKLVPPDFNNGQQHQEKSSQQKHSVEGLTTSWNEGFVEKYVFTI